jgi:hypothetical protein
VPYVGHLGYQNTIVVVKNQYYWPGMKKEVVDFIARCLECQKVKAEHKHQLVFYNHYPFLSGNGKLSQCISSLKLPTLFQ